MPHGRQEGAGNTVQPPSKLYEGRRKRYVIGRLLEQAEGSQAFVVEGRRKMGVIRSLLPGHLIQNLLYGQRCKNERPTSALAHYGHRRDTKQCN